MSLPRISLCSSLPTPLEDCERLSQSCEIVRILVKREDLTGLAMGGNKIRNLEYVFGDLNARGCDAVITTAGVQSNMCRATAAAAARVGIRCVLLLRGSGDEEVQGNLLLDNLLGADVRFIPTEDPYDDRVPGWLQDARSELEQAGLNPYVLHLTGESAGVATCAYVYAAEELVGQFAEMGVEPGLVYVTAGSGITAAGLALGFKHLNMRTRVVGVSANSSADFLSGRIVGYAKEAAGLFGLSTCLTEADFEMTDAFVGPGYGKPYPEVLRTIRVFARQEGLLLDPVYTGKCATALLSHISEGRIESGKSVVLVHSGGGPNLFAHGDVLTDEAS